MIRFFRRALSSWIVLGLFALIMIAFIVTGVGTPSSIGNLAGASSDMIAKIGGEKLNVGEVNQRIEVALQNVRQKQPELQMPTFIKQGGADQVIDQLVAARALEIWARQHGIGASKRLVDGDIASIQAFHGPTGDFDESVFRGYLAQKRITEAQVRRDLYGDAVRRQLLIPVTSGNRVPSALVMPYASLMLETRHGAIGIVPTAAIAPGAKPTDGDLNAYYGRNLAQYTQPERRVIRYALISKDQLAALPKPSDAEIKTFYDANATLYGGSETRTFSQVVLPDEAAAKALAAKVKAGTSFADAAQSAGFTAKDTAIGPQTRAQITSLATPAIADAAFAAPAGGTTAPLKSALGWHLLHVDAIHTANARSLASVHDEIAASLGKQKVDEAIADLVASIDDEISDGSSFDDVVKKHALKVVTSPPVDSRGQGPDAKGPLGDPTLQVLLKTAFEASPDDDPTVETIGNGALHALLKLGKVIPAAPLPLAAIRDRVAADFEHERAFQAARAIGQAIIAKANAGVPLAKAIADSGLRLPPPQPAGGRQLDIMQAGGRVPPPLALMFGMKKGTARLLEAPNNAGWFVVKLDTVEPGDAKTAPGLVEASRSQFGEMISQEYAEQFANAIQDSTGVLRNNAAIAHLKAQLSGSGPQ